MRILIACEFSGIVREEFNKLGHDVYSCDFLDTEIKGKHIKGDVLDHLNDGWDLMIAHPPCKYLAVSGNSWYYHPEDKHLPIIERRPHPRFPNRRKKQEEAIKFFMKLIKCSSIEKICVENPVGVMSTRFRKPDQYIQPYMFGEPQTKKTGLWLKNLPKLKPTNIVEPKVYYYKTGKKKGRGDPFWHVESLKLDSIERMKVRSRTFKGIAEAMASQWGN